MKLPRVTAANWLNMFQTLGWSLCVCGDLDDWSLRFSRDIPDLDLALEIVSGRLNFPVCVEPTCVRTWFWGIWDFYFSPQRSCRKKASLLWLKNKAKAWACFEKVLKNDGFALKECAVITLMENMANNYSVNCADSTEHLKFVLN